jgi:hypothetical protein
MTNQHIKVINGRKYYYMSIRKGKKITSKYLGPAEQRMRKPKNSIIPKEEAVVQESVQDESISADEGYIG